MFVETKNMASNPDASLSRDPMNSNVLFSQDFYFKYGRSPPFLQDATSEIPDGGAVPFTRVQQRYDGLRGEICGAPSSPVRGLPIVEGCR